MTDWALEVASKMALGVARNDEGTFTYFHLDEVAAALRRAKADGMVEAARIMDDMPSLARFNDTLAQIRFAASKLTT